MKKFLPIIVLAIIGLAILFWYGKTRELHSTGIFVTDVFVELKAEGSGRQTSDAFRKAADEIRRIDRHLGYRNSLVTELNQNLIVKDREVYELIRISRGVNKASMGAFSITLGPMLEAWGFTGGQSCHVPTPDEFTAWEQSPKDDAIMPGNDGMTVRIPKGMKVDLGGTLEGYAADRARQVMEESGIKTGLVSVGGEVVAFGNRVWKIGIKHPRKEGILAVIPLKNRAIATSGDYERFFVAFSKRYCHILDPATGMPVQGIMSASVIASNCTLANAWAVALFVGGPGKIGPVLDKMGMGWVVVDVEGKIKASKGVRAYLPGRI